MLVVPGGPDRVAGQHNGPIVRDVPSMPRRSLCRSCQETLRGLLRRLLQPCRRRWPAPLGDRLRRLRPWLCTEEDRGHVLWSVSTWNLLSTQRLCAVHCVYVGILRGPRCRTSPPVDRVVCLSCPPARPPPHFTPGRKHTCARTHTHAKHTHTCTSTQAFSHSVSTYATSRPLGCSLRDIALRPVHRDCWTCAPCVRRIPPTSCRR